MNYFLILLLVGFSTSFAAASPSEEELARRAKSHGSLIAMAQFCNFPPDEIRSLLAKLEQETLLEAKGSPFRFDAEVYRQYATEGAQSTGGILSYVPDSGPGYESNCKDVREKVSAAKAK